MTKKILTVLDVKLAIKKSNPPNLFIVAHGEVTTTGWSNGQLIPYVYITPPKDGIYEFDFVADPPTGISGQMISPINAECVWPDFPSDLNGVKVYASTNSITANL